MLFNTLVSVAIGLVGYLGDVVRADDYYTPSPSSSSRSCATITTSDVEKCPTPTQYCITLACIELKPVTQHCGCPSIYTSKTCQTACPTSCGSTSYITAIEDCFPTSPPPYTPTSSSTTPSYPTYTPSTTPSTTPYYPTYTPSTTPSTPPYYPTYTPSTSPPTLPSSYGNSTKTRTRTKTEIITVTTCPPSTTCVGQTVTYTSTEPCPSTTCTCVLPSVTYTTTVLPLPETSKPVVPTTSPEGNKPPVPSTARPSATPTFIESNVAAGRWSLGVGVGVFGGLLVAVLGML